MNQEGIIVKDRPQLNEPVFIAGFEGWGNALDVASSMVKYLVRKFDANQFADLNPDLFFRYDDYRPRVQIEAGTMKRFSPPGGQFYFIKSTVCGKDIICLDSTEPNLQWYRFTDDLLDFCRFFGVKKIITLGSMYDSVLHSERIISGIASDMDELELLKQKNVVPIYYQGPSAVHSIIHDKGGIQKFNCISLWCHCPYYLQGTTHFGLISTLGKLLAELGNFQIDTQDLEESWKEMEVQIENLIENNPKLKSAIENFNVESTLTKSDIKRKHAKKGEKVIQLKDFLDND